MQNQPYFPGGNLATGHYEFNDEENQKIAATGARATMWGYVSVVTGVLALLGLIVSLVFKAELIAHGLEPSYVTVFVVSLVPIVLTHLVIAVLYIGAGKSLQAIVHTQGNDIEHLMQSLDRLGTAFMVEFAIGMLAVVVSAGVGVQMAIENVAAEKAAELARAEVQAAALAAAAEEEEDADEADEGDTEDEEGEDAEDEDAEGEDAEDEDEGDTEGGSGAQEAGEDDEEGGSGGADDAEEDAEAADAEAADAEVVEEPVEEPAEEPAAN